MKKIILILAMLITAAIAYSQAPNTWTQKADFGGGIRVQAVGFSIGNKGYIGTGSDGSSTYKDFWEYDPNLNVWTQKADFGGTEREAAVGLSIGSKGYIGTGDNNGGYFKDFWEYDPASNTWTRKADFGGTARNDAVGFSIGSKGYIGMGITFNGINNYYKDFWEYDPATNSWTQKADVGGDTRQSVVGFSIGSKGYIGTGFHYPTSYKDFWEYDPAINAWTQKADFGGPVSAGAVGFSIGVKGYIGTGSGTHHEDFWEYDTNSNAWTKKADFGGTVRQFATGFSIGSKGYIGTGGDANGNRKDFWEYSTECNGLTVYADADGDGYGNKANSLFVADCIVPTGYVYDSTDCNDTNAAVHPNAIEVIGDGIDNNCNGLVDEAVNNALSFDGINDYVNIGNLGVTSVNTREFWFKPNNVAGNSNQYFIDFGGNNYWVQLYDVDGDGKLELRAGAGNTTYVDGIAEFTDITKWYYVAVTMNSSGILTIYVNGNYDRRGTVVAGTPGTFVLGRNSSGANYFNGLIDEVRIWNVARTQAEIQSDMAGAVCGNTPGLVAYYPFDQGIAGGTNTGVTTANDVTANNNNGTLYNFALTGATSNWVTGVPGLSDSATFYQDADADGYGNASVSVVAPVCNPPSGYVHNKTDCNDANASIHPGAREICGNGIDDNCNGQIDEQCLVITPYAAGIKEGNSGNTIMPFLVMLNAPAIKDCGVKYRTVAATATGGVDYIKDSGILHFVPGEISKIVSIQIIGDKTVEPNEYFTLRLSNPVNLTIATKSVPGIIVNDDRSTNFTITSPPSFPSIAATVNGVKVQSNASVQIMPNPSKGNFNLQMQLPAKSASTTLALYNNLGATVWQQDAGRLSGSVNRNIALENKLSAGVYVLMVQHGDTRLMQKVVVIK